MDEELRFHIDSCVEQLVRQGVPVEEARRRARLEFGSVETRKEECRQAWGLQRWDELRADLRQTLRTIRRNPGFAAVAVLSMALGIGANTAIFGVYDAVMLKLLPVRAPEELVFVRIGGTDCCDGPPYPFFEILRKHTSSYQAISAYSPSTVELTYDRGRELARGMWVSGNFFENLGVRPVLGRALTAADDETVGKGGPDGPVVVISTSYWQQRFGGDPQIVGKTVQAFGKAAVIAGVLQPEAMTVEPGYPVDLAMPMALSDPAKMLDRKALWLEIIARLKPGISTEQAQAESAALLSGYVREAGIAPETQKRLYGRLMVTSAARGMNSLRQQFAKPVAVLLALASLVLLAACVNSTSLLLARAMARQRDFAVRLAIGASRGRLIRQSLTEAMTLAGLGALLGMLLAHWGSTALASYFAQVEGNGKVVLDLGLNLRMLGFSLAVTILCGLILGVIPALRAAKLDPAGGLGARGAAGNQRSMTVGRALVLVQVALSMVLLGGSALFLRTLRELESTSLGFSHESILTMEITPEKQWYGTPQWSAAQSEIVERVSRIPGVESASWATYTPMSGRGRGAVIEVAGFTPGTDRDKFVHMAAVAPGYFKTLGVPVVLGRDISARDHADAAKAVVISESTAKFYFADRGENPIGQKLKFTNYDPAGILYEIVGVVADVRHDNLRDTPPRFVYLPIPQALDRINRLALAVRSSGGVDPLQFTSQVRNAVLETNGKLLIANVNTIERQVRQSLMRERLVAVLSSTFGVVAVVLACVGLYGVLAFAVTRRTQEIGIRMALGATRTAVIWLVLREAVLLAVAGIVAGFALAAKGFETIDGVAFGSAAAILLLCAGAAAIVPSRRISMLDPTQALRRE